jgi:putative inorganic carbon (HCO3(-)) transporter
MDSPRAEQAPVPASSARPGHSPAGGDEVLRTAVAAGGFPLTAALALLTSTIVPAYVVRWHIGPLPTTLLESGILLTLAACLLESFRAGTWPRWRSPLTVPAALFLVVGLVSVVVAPDRHAALGLYRAYLLEPIAFGLVLFNVVTTARRAAMIVGALAAGATVAGVANAVVVLAALRNHDFDVLNTPPVVIYNTANAVALYLVPLIAVAGAMVLHWPSRRGRVAAAGFLLVGLGSVLLSFSRGGYLALGAVAIGLALSHRRRWPLLIGAAVIAIAVIQIPVIGHRVRGEIDLNDPHNTLVGRFHLWSAALAMLRDHPIFGAGLSGFATKLAPYWNPTHTDRFTYPHNILLNFWSETGLAGVVAFAWIMVAGFARAWRGWRQAAPGWRAIHLGVLLALVAVVVHGLVDVPYWKNDLSLEFWVLLALAFAPATSGELAATPEMAANLA